MPKHTARTPRSSSKKQPAASPSLEGYLSDLPADVRQQMLRMRDTIHSAVPEATETFGYGMPAFAIEGKPFIWYAAWKKHVSLYPVNEETRQALADQLAGYELSGKGTIRFRSDQELPASLIVQLAKARLAQVRSHRTVTPASGSRR